MLACRIMQRSSGILAALFIGVSALASAGCGGADIEEICLLREECLSGNDADIEACVASYELEEEVANIQGCSDEFDAYYLCFYDVVDCNSTDLGTPCMATKDCTPAPGAAVSCKNNTCRVKKFEIEDLDDCEAELSAYAKCSNE